MPLQIRRDCRIHGNIWLGYSVCAAVHWFFSSVSVPSKEYRIVCASHLGRGKGEHHVIIEVSGGSDATGAEDMLGWRGQHRISQ